MARGWYGLEIGIKVEFPLSSIEVAKGKIVYLYPSDKNRAQIQLEDGTLMDVVCEWCKKID